MLGFLIATIVFGYAAFFGIKRIRASRAVPITCTAPGNAPATGVKDTNAGTAPQAPQAPAPAPAPAPAAAAAAAAACADQTTTTDDAVTTPANGNCNKSGAAKSKSKSSKSKSKSGAAVGSTNAKSTTNGTGVASVAAAESSNDESDYDLILNLPLTNINPEFSDSDAKSRWVLRVRPATFDMLKNFNGTILGVIGQFNQGKSFFLRLLSSSVITGPEGHQVHTTGLSLKFIQSEGLAGFSKGSSYLFIDSAGTNSPIDFTQMPSIGSLKSSDDLEKCLAISEKQDAFYRDVALSLSEFPFLVVSQTTRLDVEHIREVAKERQSRRPDGNPVIVVHNFMHVRTVDELLNAWDMILRVFAVVSDEFLGAGLPDESVLHGPTIEPLTLRNDARTSAIPGTRHIVLVNNDTEWGAQYNSAAISVIREWIRAFTTNDMVTNWTNLTPLFDQIGKRMAKTFEGCEGLDIDWTKENNNNNNNNNKNNNNNNNNNSSSSSSSSSTADDKRGRLIPRFREGVVPKAGAICDLVLEGALNINRPRDAANPIFKNHFVQYRARGSGKSYLVLDLNLTGVDMKKDFHWDITQDGKNLIVEGRLLHRADPFESPAIIESLHPSEATFKQSFDLPFNVIHESVKWEQTEDRYVRCTFELKDRIVPPRVESNSLGMMTAGLKDKTMNSGAGVATATATTTTTTTTTGSVLTSPSTTQRETDIDIED